ncbi:hypothetical protein HPB50_026428 [Hyalomma asiaticum]|uniref:Uncharacterized protein n=1 Tax=Hyalomma asiaticum TaxID=266040 RepID=A0ACB7RR43_HYAAI|nr:hypothetical protein HPB50_026428 [Hyalomma asiaticum]
MGSCSTLDLAEEDDGSFTDEYSVRIEVYETEVTDSGGSAPIIKISGLCDTDHRASYLFGQQSLLSFTYEDEPDKCGDTPLYNDKVSRFQSMQVLRGGPAVPAPPQPEPSATQAAAPRNEALKSSKESIPFTPAFAGDASSKWPVISPNFAGPDCARRQRCCEPHNSFPPPLQSCYKCSAFGGGQPRRKQ